MSMKHLMGYIVVSLSISLLVGGPALAKSKHGRYYSYAIPFSCGISDAGEGGVVAGEYDTAVTVTNLNPFDTKARASVQLTDPAAGSTDRIRRTLPAGSSFLIDCERILGGAFILPVVFEADDFLQGVLTIDSRRELNVVVQSSASATDGGISVQSRQVMASVIKRRTARDRSVEICHIPPGNPVNRHTIEVDESAVSAHLGHGDHTGSCDDDGVEHQD